MANLKYPVVIWQDAQGCFTATTLSGFPASAIDLDSKRSVEQLKKYLVWKHRNDDDDVDPNFSEPNIGKVNVPIRTMYRIRGQRDYPADHPVNVPVTYVWGKRADDSINCVLPFLQKDFYCRDESLLEQLVVDQAQSILRGTTPARLSELLTPGPISLDTIFIPVKSRKQHKTAFRSRVLESVGSLLGSRQQRKLYSRAWQRDSLIDDLASRLDESRGNILLLGPSGVGKTTMLVNAIRKLEKDRSNEPSDEDRFRFKVGERFWQTSAERLIAGMQFLGQWEERVEGVIHELASLQGVLCAQSLQPLIRLGGREPIDSIASFLTPYLVNDELRMVVESTREELESCRRLLPGFDSLFQIFEIEPMNIVDARKVLIASGDQFKQNHGVDFEIEAAELTIQLFRRFLPYSVFPGKCVPFWLSMFERLKADKKKTLDRNFVVDKFIRLTGLPEPLVRDDYELPAEEVQSYFSNRIIDQTEACHRVTNIVTTFKAGLNDPAKPIGVQLFCGPTGVGKTEMAKALADYMFGGGDEKNRLVRLDMSEYSGPAASERLLMQSDGKPSDFIQRVREQPFVIILLDEIEKASHEIFDVLMGVFDEGRLTDRWGRTTDFRSSIIIMTSNLGVRRTSPVGFDQKDTGSFERAVKKFFRPEFYNRFDAVVPFQPLKRESIKKITQLELAKLAKRDGLVSRKLLIEWDDEVIELLSRQGFHPRLGARPLQRTIEELVVVPLSRKLATEPELKSRTVILMTNNENIVIETLS